MLSRVDAADLAEDMAMYDLSPWGERPTDIHNARLLMRLAANSGVELDPEVALMKWDMAAKPKRQSADEMKAILMGMCRNVRAKAKSGLLRPKGR